MSFIVAPHLDLDIAAVRLAGHLYRTQVARGVPEACAWETVLDLLGSAHPTWSAKVVEREAVRLLGLALLEPAWEAETMSAEAAGVTRNGRRAVPLDLLIDLATPEVADACQEWTAAHAAE